VDDLEMVLAAAVRALESVLPGLPPVTSAAVRQALVALSSLVSSAAAPRPASAAPRWPPLSRPPPRPLPTGQGPVGDARPASYAAAARLQEIQAVPDPAERALQASHFLAAPRSAPLRSPLQSRVRDCRLVHYRGVTRMPYRLLRQSLSLADPALTSSTVPLISFAGSVTAFLCVDEATVAALHGALTRDGAAALRVDDFDPALPLSPAARADPVACSRAFEQFVTRISRELAYCRHPLVRAFLRDNYEAHLPALDARVTALHAFAAADFSALSGDPPAPVGGRL
jgi:hypothetical protein